MRETVRRLDEMCDAAGFQASWYLNEVPLAVVDDDRVLAAADQVDAALRVDGDPGHVPVLPGGGQLLPALDDLVAVWRRGVTPHAGPSRGRRRCDTSP